MSGVLRSFKKLSPYVFVERNFGLCSVLLVNRAPTDPIQKIFLDKLKEYNRLNAQSGKMVDITPEQQKRFDETLSNLKKAYGADKEDFSKFPTFTFKDPQLDPINMEERK